MLCKSDGNNPPRNPSRARSMKYFELGFGAEEHSDNTQESAQQGQRGIPKKANKINIFSPRNIQETSKKKLINIQERVFQSIKDNPHISRRELEVLLNCSHGSIKYHVSQLIQKGIIAREGSTKAGKWVIIEK